MEELEKVAMYFHEDYDAFADFTGEEAVLQDLVLAISEWPAGARLLVNEIDSMLFVAGGNEDDLHEIVSSLGIAPFGSSTSDFLKLIKCRVLAILGN